MAHDSSPGLGLQAVTPSDSTVVRARALYVGTTGALSLQSLKDGENEQLAAANKPTALAFTPTFVVITSVPVGLLQIGAYRVGSTNTTASNITAVF